MIGGGFTGKKFEIHWFICHVFQQFAIISLIISVVFGKYNSLRQFPSVYILASAVVRI